MRRSSSLRRALLALVVLALFMVILRTSRPSSQTSLGASGSKERAKPSATKGVDNFQPQVANNQEQPDSAKEDWIEDTRKQIKDTNEAAKVATKATEDTKSNNKGQGVANAEDPDEKSTQETSFDAASVYKRIVESPDSPPVVIFSKSYCPHSQRAKILLLEGHSINPQPRVVELDKMDHGAELQEYLAEITGRHTVPNILVNGVSRGGASDLVELGDALVPSFLDWGRGKLSISVQEPQMAQA